MAQSRPVTIDGSNGAYVKLSQDDEPKLSNILAVRKEAQRRGWDPIGILDDGSLEPHG